ncbi:MAG: ATP-dependent DNA helicase [Microbacterium gubbeenense]
MNALRRAWEREYGAGSVVGLAPSAGAAQVLAEDLRISTENTAMWLQTHATTGETFRSGQLVIIDEASLAGTLTLDAISELAMDAGAKVLLVGDYAQLQSVDAGGAFGMLVHSRHDVPELSGIHRFTQAWERAATLALRDGKVDVIDTYAEHDRIIEGETESMIDCAYSAWRRDLLNGKAAVLVTDSSESVLALNQRARTDLILDGTVGGTREATLHDGAAASVGDVVITRKNDRRLTARHDWVRNGDRWRVVAVRDDRSVSVRRDGRRWGGTVVLPPEYVAEHLDLGYAVTAYRAQGITVDSSHVLVDASMTRENLYVAMTRGRDTNLAYVPVDKPQLDHTEAQPGDDPDATARSILFGVLQHVGAETSAHEAIESEQRRWSTIAQFGAEYETIAAVAQHDRWVALVRASGLDSEQTTAAVESDAFGPLTAAFRRAEANNHDLDVLLPRLVKARAFGDADDVAAVLHYRVAKATSRPAGSGRRRRPVRYIAGLIPEALGPMDAEMRQALDGRRALMEERADAVLDEALATGETWLKDLGGLPRGALELAKWRRAARVVAAYRDRYGVTGDRALGPAPEAEGQRLDQQRAAIALRDATSATTEPPRREPVPSRQPMQL